MSATNELLENTPMRISMALNVALTLGIGLLLVAPDATSPGSGLRSVTPTVVAVGEVAHASQVRNPAPTGRELRGRDKHEVAYAGEVRYPAPAGLERRSRVKREAAPPATSGTIAPAVADTLSTTRARVRTR